MNNSSLQNFTSACQSLRLLSKKIKPQTSTELKTVIAALYLAQNNQLFRFTNLIGLLQLDYDRKLKTNFLRMYNLQTMKLSFQIELYFDFIKFYKQSKDNQKFYYFDYPVGTIGILFKNKQDALIMYNKIKTDSPTIQELNQLRKQKIEKQKKENQNKSFFKSFKRKLLGQQQQIIKQSQIVKFQVTSTVTMDQNGNFVMTGNSPVKKDIQQRLNLNQKQKNDPQIQQMIAQNLVLHNLKKQAIATKNVQVIDMINKINKQEQQYYQDCRKSRAMNLPPPPPLPSLFNPQVNSRTSMGTTRNNLLDEIRKGKKLNHVQTIQKGGLKIDISNMDSDQRDDFASAMKRKIAMRKKALNIGKEDSDSD